MLLDLLLLVVGVVILVSGAEGLVRGAAALATKLGISAALVGLTIVAYGTSAPELTVSLYAAFKGNADVATGNVVGSNIANVGLILAMTAVVRAVPCSRRFAQLEMPIMLGVSLLTVGMMMSGELVRVEGIILLAAFVAYLVVAVRRDLRDVQESERLGQEELEVHGLARKDSPLRRGWFDVLLVAIGIGMLALGTKLFIDSAVNIAETMGISQRIIGLTLVAVGTSLPELATSIVAAVRKHEDIAVGNIIGSNICNLVLVLGATAAVTPLAVSAALLRVDVLVMLGFSAILLPMMLTGGRISRREGAVLLAGYAVYVVYLYVAGPPAGE